MLELNLQRAVLKDRYEIRGRISSGSYSEVFVARDRGDDSKRGNAVVIKALNSHLQGTPYPDLEQMLAEKFQSEAVIHIALSWGFAKCGSHKTRSGYMLDRVRRRRLSYALHRAII